MNQLTPFMVKSLMAYKKSCDEGAAKAKMRGDKLDANHRGDRDEFTSSRIQEYWHRAAVQMHISIAIAEYITRKAKQQ